MSLAAYPLMSGEYSYRSYLGLRYTQVVRQPRMQAPQESDERIFQNTRYWWLQAANESGTTWIVPVAIRET